MVASQSPTALKRWIAFELKRLREAAGRSRAETADRLGKALAQVGHLETGRNLPTPADVEVLLGWYGHAERIDFFRELIKRAKRGKDWWVEDFADAVPEWFSLYLGLESAAAKLESWDALIVTGILQTRDYARAAITGGDPRLTDEEVERRVELRMERQTVLGRSDPPQVWSVIAEHVLRTPVGGPNVLAEQLQHLLKLAELPNIEIQVLPTGLGAHPGLDGTFTVLTYPPELGDDLGSVYVQNRIKGRFYEEPADIATYREDLTRLQVAARTPADSRSVIAAIAQEVIP